MTRLPNENWDVTGVEGPAYKVGPKCSVATCNHWADEAHHIWRRSFLSGDYRWVRLWNDTVVQNMTALCWRHHRQVTDNQARIDYFDDPDRATGEFTFIDIDEHEQVLVPQPKTLREFTNAEPDDIVAVVTEDAPCPTCGHRKRTVTELEPGAKRNRASWTVSVPKDERENGAAVLDELALACAEKLGRADHRSWKYYTLAEVLAAFALGNVDVSDFMS